MENYSGRNLTESNDKLSAISGLANFVLGNRGLSAESYLAGLWKENLVDGLLWYVSSPGASRPRSTYIAPTWSWASVTGSIEYFHERYQFRFHSHMTIKYARCTASRCDPTGRVTAGVIRLDGLLVRVDLAAIPYSSSTKSTYTTSGASPIRAEGQPLTFVREYKDTGMTDMEKPRWYEIMCDEEIVETSPDLDHAQNHQCMSVKDESAVCFLQNTRNEQRMYFCLSVGEMVDSLTGGQRHWFLVLQKTLEAEETYRRVGIGYFQHCKRSFPLFYQSDVRNISLW